MTTVAIIGGGIVGRSLLYALAKGAGLVSKAHLFQSTQFSFPCSVNSTAIVAPRGIARGLSPLGDLLADGFEVFDAHFKQDSPSGVYPITQFTGAGEKLDQFKRRYPECDLVSQFSSFSFKKEFYMAQENAYMVEPQTYLDWILVESKKCLEVDVVDELVTELTSNSIRTFQGNHFEFDRVYVASGVGNRFWKQTSKSIQGAYLEFKAQDLGPVGFSLTLDGDNIIYHPQSKLLLGSSTLEVNHELAPISELESIYQRLKGKLDFELPEFKSGIIKTGLREKASKRMPYIKIVDGHIYVGGMYKNGYTLSLATGKKALAII